MAEKCGLEQAWCSMQCAWHAPCISATCRQIETACCSCTSEMMSCSVMASWFDDPPEAVPGSDVAPVAV
eukprot:716473-Pelagomonas_calceolata.AAC.1